MEPLPTPHNNFFRFTLSHLPSARSLIETQLSKAALAELDLETLRLLKYSRRGELAEQLRRILQSLLPSQGEDWFPELLEVIRVYIMSADNGVDDAQYEQTLKSVFPTQFERNSIAHRLLQRGRDEGRQEGEQLGLKKGEQLGLEKGEQLGLEKGEQLGL
ncbi:MAG: Rpn family recombination-promoting nuclease/putative transposase, partial [Planctomycetota bacterium]